MDAEVNEWTDYLPDVERIKRMQDEIDALKFKIDELNCDKRELITALSDVIGNADFGMIDDSDEDIINCARTVLCRYRS